MKSFLSLFVLVSAVTGTGSIACGGGSDTPANGTSSGGASSSGTNTSGGGGGGGGDGDGGKSSNSSSSSTSSSGGPTGSCAAAGTLLCERACACATDGKCHIGIDIDAGSPGAINFDTKEKCLDFYVELACLGGGEAGFDYASCEASVKSASCIDAVGDKAILFPSTCQVN